MAFNNTTYNIISLNSSEPVNDLDYRLQRLLQQPHQLMALLLSVVAITLNLTSLCALSQIRNRINTHLCLIISLALSDIMVGLSVLLYVLNKVIHQGYPPGVGPWNQRVAYRCTFVFIKCLNSVGLNISLLNLMGMAIDHFVAIIKPLHYPAIMTKRKSIIMISVLWFLATVGGFSDFLSGFDWYRRYKAYYNYCELIWLTPYNDEYLTFALAFVCLIVMLVIYIKIYIKINERQMPHETCHNVMKRKNHRPLFTTLFILGSFILCWLPLCIFQITVITLVRVNPAVVERMAAVLRHADQYLYVLLLLNCIADPVIYAVRVHEVKLGYRRFFARCCPGCLVIRERTDSGRYLLSSRSTSLRKSSTFV